jgi:hypothetical protein
MMMMTADHRDDDDDRIGDDGDNHQHQKETNCSNR